MMKYDIKPYKSGFRLQLLERLLFFNVVMESYYGKTVDELLDVIIELEKEKLTKKTDMKKSLLQVTVGIILPLLLAGCSASWYQARDVKKQHKLNYQYPNSLALDCAKWFPTKDSVGKSIFIPADNVDLLPVVDSLQNYINILLSASKPVVVNGIAYPVDSARFINAFNLLQSKYNALRGAYKPCKPDTFKTAPVYITNTALVTAWQTKYTAVHDSLTTSTANLRSVKHGKNIWMYIAIGACLVIIGGAAISIYKFFNGGAILGTVKKII